MGTCTQGGKDVSQHGHSEPGRQTVLWRALLRSLVLAVYTAVRQSAAITPR